MNSYFVVGCTADGLTFDGPLSQDELKKRLNDGYYRGDRAIKFLETTPRTDGFALQMDEDELFIIQGKAVVPKPQVVAKTWDLP